MSAIEVIAYGQTVRSARYIRYVDQVLVEVLAERVDDKAPTFKLNIKPKEGRHTGAPDLSAEQVAEVTKTVCYMVQTFLDEL